MPSLRFFRESDLLVEYRLRPGQVTIGRADGCDVALPGETVSRVHCIVRGRRGAWEVLDRSRHGVRLDGAVIEKKAPLQDGSTITFGPYRVEVHLQARDARPTAPQEPDQTHEILVGNERDGLRVERARLVVVDGRDAGRRHVLRHPRLSVGGAGSHIDLQDDGLVRDHAWLRISRGRTMVEPGRGPAWLDGQRVRDITPLYPDEELRIGGTVVRVERGLEEEVPLASRFGEMVADARSMRQLFGTLRRMSGHHYTVLVVGESGTGKELVARGIHQHSPRADGAFVALNCGAITDSSSRAILRAREGGVHRRRGPPRWRLPRGRQGHALPRRGRRAARGCAGQAAPRLGDGGVRRVGSTDVDYPDVRIVAATNRDLAQAVREAPFARICSSGSRCSRSRCRRSGAGPRTSRCSAGPSVGAWTRAVRSPRTPSRC